MNQNYTPFPQISVMKFTYTEEIDGEAVDTPKVALFNNLYLTPENVIKLIDNGEENEYVIVIDETQWHGVFHDIGNPWIPHTLN